MAFFSHFCTKAKQPAKIAIVDIRRRILSIHFFNASGGQMINVDERTRLENAIGYINPDKVLDKLLWSQETTKRSLFSLSLFSVLRKKNQYALNTAKAR